jgi:hypothetical protein
MQFTIYEFETDKGKLLVLAGGNRRPMRIQQDVDGDFYINRWENVAFLNNQYHKDYPTIKMLGFNKSGSAAKPEEAKETRDFRVLTAHEWDYQMAFATRYPSWQDSTSLSNRPFMPFGGVKLRQLPAAEIDIQALLADEREGIEAEARHWENS